MGKDQKLRNQGIRGNVHEGNSVLDAGSGFGNMSSTAMKICNNNLSLVLYDPLPQMLTKTAKRLGSSLYLTSGVFEHIPFQDEVFDAVLCGYSLRDAISLKTAISEIHRVLKKNGRLVVVDLGKPDSGLIRFGVSFYLRLIVPLIAFAAGGRLGLKFGMLYNTFKAWPKNEKLQQMLLEKFTSVTIKKAMLGGAIMVSAQK